MALLTPARVRSIFAKAGLKSIGAMLAKSGKSTASIRRRRARDTTIKTGTSKLGGHPDLPEGMKWPKVGRRPLAFLGQFNLAEAAHAGLPKAFPREGMLWFFYDDREQPWGLSPKDRSGFRVVYAEAGTPLKRVRSAKGTVDDARACFAACAVRFKAETTFREPEYDDYRKEKNADDAMGLFTEVLHAGQGDETTPLHRLGGHAVMLQGGMEEQCAQVDGGMDVGGRMTKASLAKGARLGRTAKEWVLLLQLDSDDAAGWMWGDLGVLTFWIREEDLRARRFDRVWCILQCG